ncbi:TPA: hypothetical protein ACRVR1_004328 [Escherichia coli]|nr:hypothetical protein [Escherichia coli]
MNKTKGCLIANFATVPYAVLAGHGADGGLMGHFLGMCNVVYLLGAQES